MLGAKSKIPPHDRYHHHPKFPVRPACNNILEAIGNTPLVRLNSVTKHLQNVEIYVKCEYLNPGGSIKDRVALAMVEGKKDQIENFVRENANHSILEPTSGNTGVGLALVSAVNGKWYNVTLQKFITYLPENHKEPNILKVSEKDGCHKVLETMINAKQDVALVMNSKEKFVGLVSLNSLRHILTEPAERFLKKFGAYGDEPVVKCMEKGFNLLALNSDYEHSTAGLVSRVLDIGRYVVIGNAEFYEPDNKEKVIKQLCSPINVVSAEDMAAFIQEYSARPSSSSATSSWRRQLNELPACDACKLDATGA